MSKLDICEPGAAVIVDDDDFREKGPRIRNNILDQVTKHKSPYKIEPVSAEKEIRFYAYFLVRLVPQDVSRRDECLKWYLDKFDDWRRKTPIQRQLGYISSIGCRQCEAQGVQNPCTKQLLNPFERGFQGVLAHYDEARKSAEYYSVVFAPNTLPPPANPFWDLSFLQYYLAHGVSLDPEAERLLTAEDSWAIQLSKILLDRLCPIRRQAVEKGKISLDPPLPPRGKKEPPRIRVLIDESLRERKFFNLIEQKVPQGDAEAYLPLSRSFFGGSGQWVDVKFEYRSHSNLLSEFYAQNNQGKPVRERKARVYVLEGSECSHGQLDYTQDPKNELQFVFVDENTSRLKKSGNCFYIPPNGFAILDCIWESIFILNIGDTLRPM